METKKEKIDTSYLEAGTIADKIYEEQKLNPKSLTLTEKLLEYEEKHRIDNW